jgi:hypothetical protein
MTLAMRTFFSLFTALYVLLGQTVPAGILCIEKDGDVFIKDSDGLSRTWIVCCNPEELRYDGNLAGFNFKLSDRPAEPGVNIPLMHLDTATGSAVGHMFSASIPCTPHFTLHDAQLVFAAVDMPAPFLPNRNLAMAWPARGNSLLMAVLRQ